MPLVDLNVPPSKLSSGLSVGAPTRVMSPLPPLNVPPNIRRPPKPLLLSVIGLLLPLNVPPLCSKQNRPAHPVTVIEADCVIVPVYALAIMIEPTLILTSMVAFLC